MKYNRLKEEFDRKYKTAAESYMRNKVDDLKEAQPGRAYKILKTWEHNQVTVQMTSHSPCQSTKHSI